MEIRELRRGDVPSLSRLIADVQRELPEAMNFAGAPDPERISESVEWKLEAVRSGDMADLVAMEGGEVVADCEVLRHGTEGTVGIIVRRGFRGRGIGEALVERCASKARGLGVRIVRARVMESNARAVSFFERLGFEKRTGVSGDAGAVLMSKTLL